MKERLAGRWREVAGPSPAAANGAIASGAGGSGKSGAKGSGKGGSGSGASCGDFVSEQQRALFALLNCYADLLLPCRAYPASKDPGGGGGGGCVGSALCSCAV